MGLSIGMIQMGRAATRAAPTFFMALFSLASPLFAAPPHVLLSTTTLLPGETLRVEVDDLSPAARCKVAFMGKLYPLFSVGPDARRALIGIPLGAKPGEYRLALKKSASSGSMELPKDSYRIEIASRTYIIENVNFAPGKTALMKSEHRESALIHKKNRYLSRDQQWEGPFMNPVEGERIGEFGLKRMRNGTIDAGFHKGIDLRAPKGTPVLAANAGTVVLAQTLKAHGKTVLINHGQGVMTIYLHMQSLSVKDHQKVRKGQPIGKVGSTGLSTAPHVHFQVFVHGVPVDPGQWTKEEM